MKYTNLLTKTALSALTFSLAILMTASGSAQPSPVSDVTPFDGCEGRAFLSGSDGSQFDVYEVLGLDPEVAGAVTVSSLVGYDGEFNGIGYSQFDNRIYALEGADLTRNLVAVGPNDALTVATIFGVTLSGSANIGAVDGDGFLHVTRGDDATVNVIDVVPGSITFGMVVDTYIRVEANAGDGTTLGPDIAYNPADGLFYSIRDNNELVSMDPRSGAVELLDTIPAAEVPTDPVGIGALFIPAGNQFFFIGLDSGDVSVIDLGDPDYVPHHLATSQLNRN